MDSFVACVVAVLSAFVLGHALDCWRDVRLAQAKAKKPD